MKSRHWLFFVLLAGLCSNPARSSEETLTLPQGENIVLTVPDRLKFRVIQQNNTLSAEVTDAEKTVILQLGFMTNIADHLDSVEKQRAIISDFSAADIEQSVEQKLIFKKIATLPTAGQYVVITDGNLLGHATPPGQYLKLTRGVKVSSDFAVVFTILSQDETSWAYLAALRMAREGVVKK